jgi:tetratricopeptide (TPR) repeat protein
MIQQVSLSPSSDFRAVAKGLVKLHELFLAGENDSDALRDEMDLPYSRLTESEIQLAQRLSEDLYSIAPGDKSPLTSEMNPQVQDRLKKIQKRMESGQWVDALDGLHRWRSYLPPEMLGGLRGMAWRAGGVPEAAAAFYRHVTHLSPENGLTRALYLYSVFQYDESQASDEADEALRAHEQLAPEAVILLSSIVFVREAHRDPDKFARKSELLIELLNAAIARIPVSHDTASIPMFCMAKALLGYCYEGAGQESEALRCFSEGLSVSPDDDGLLVSRGILRYGTSSATATGDFQRSIDLNTKLVWPYLYLAHYYLKGRRFDLCLGMCEVALKQQPSPAVQSRLHEWRAIAQAESAMDKSVVIDSFRSAIKADPLNDSAVQNLNVYLRSLDYPSSGSPGWIPEAPATVRSFGAECRSRLASRIAGAIHAA